MAVKQYEAVVIGAGPAGYVNAIRLGQLGVETACIEMGELGGVCLNWGCIPSKAFIHVAKLYDEIKHGAQFGIEVKDVTLNAAKMQEWKEGVVKKLTGGVAALFKANNVERIIGQARFKDAHTLIVNQNGEETEISFKRCVIATGGSPIEIPGFEIDKDIVMGAKEALALSKIPKNLVVIGGGVIGMEMATFFSKLGAKVSVVEMADQILPGIEKDIVKVIEKSVAKNDVDIYTEAKAKGWKKSGKSAVVTIETKDGEKELNADKILLSVGVRPNTAGIGLEDAGVKLTDRGFIKIDERLQTSQPHIFAIGDVAGPPMLAHKGSKEGLVAAHIISGERDMYDVRAMPAAIFTDPEIATVGLTEKEATEKGHKVAVGKFPFSASGRALAMEHAEGFVRIVRDQESDRVLGMQIVGAGASDIIAEGALAIEMGATAEDIALTVHTHPTLPETIMEAAEHSHGIAIHTMNRRKSIKK